MPTSDAAVAIPKTSPSSGGGRGAGECPMRLAGAHAVPVASTEGVTLGRGRVRHVVHAGAARQPFCRRGRGADRRFVLLARLKRWCRAAQQSEGLDLRLLPLALCAACEFHESGRRRWSRALNPYGPTNPHGVLLWTGPNALGPAARHPADSIGAGHLDDALSHSLPLAQAVHSFGLFGAAEAAWHRTQITPGDSA